MTCYTNGHDLLHRQAAASQDEAEENDATEEEMTSKGENDESGTTARWHD